MNSAEQGNMYDIKPKTIFKKLQLKLTAGISKIKYYYTQNWSEIFKIECAKRINKMSV